MRDEQNSLRAVVMTGLFAAMIYIGIWVLRIPLPAVVGRPFIHFGNTLTAVDILNGYAATSWLTMLEVVVVAAVLSAIYKGMKYNDSKKNIIILAVIAGVTKIFTSYATTVVEALMAGTALQPALVAAFLSLLATVINSCSTAVCTPILYFALKDITVRVMKRAH